MTIKDVAELTGTSYAPAQKLVGSLIDLGILEQEGERQRDKNFSFKRYLDILEKE